MFTVCTFSTKRSNWVEFCNLTRCPVVLGDRRRIVCSNATRCSLVPSNNLEQKRRKWTLLLLSCVIVLGIVHLKLIELSISHFFGELEILSRLGRFLVDESLYFTMMVYWEDDYGYWLLYVRIVIEREFKHRCISQAFPLSLFAMEAFNLTFFTQMRGRRRCQWEQFHSILNLPRYSKIKLGSEYLAAWTVTSRHDYSHSRLHSITSHQFYPMPLEYDGNDQLPYNQLLITQRYSWANSQLHWYTNHVFAEEWLSSTPSRPSSISYPKSQSSTCAATYLCTNIVYNGKLGIDSTYLKNKVLVSKGIWSCILLRYLNSKYM